jgi:predicted ATP-grasp superfamily ATP-dependent carboligase
MASDPSFVEHLNVRTPSYSGPTGIVGVLHQAASEAGLETVSLWAPVSHYAAGLTNSKGSLALVRALDQVAGLHVDTGELEESAAAFEGQVARAVEAEPRLRQLVQQLEEAAGRADEDVDHGPLPSGDELAEDLMRFLRERDEPTP